jgi:hypothetical protein
LNSEQGRERHADPQGAPLLLPDRLAAALGLGSFARAKGCCEVCGRPHGKIVHHLGDGRWFDDQHETWRDGRGRAVAGPAYGEYRNLKQTHVVLATAHLDHNPGNSRPGNLRALCQRCHLIHDRPEHRRRIKTTILMRRALGDLFLGAYQR